MRGSPDCRDSYTAAVHDAAAQANPYKTSLSKSLVGPAGEHHCLAQLLVRGFLATPAPPGTPEADLIVLSLDGAVAATVQVKTRTRGSDKGWMMRKKHENAVRPHLFYAFVDFEEFANPAVYVIPSKTVAEVIAKAHKIWLHEPGKSHNDHDMRRVIPTYPFAIPGFESGWMTKYQDKWNQIRPADTTISGPEQTVL